MQLIEQAEEQFQQLLAFIESVPARKRTQTVERGARDKNFRDVLMHLYEWHAMLERWYREGMDGDEPAIPAAGYKWRELSKLNAVIWHQYQDVTLNKAIKKVKLSHARVLKLIAQHTEEEMLTKQYYKWTKTGNLYSYFAENTFKHYKWALQQCQDILNELNRT